MECKGSWEVRVPESSGHVVQCRLLLLLLSLEVEAEQSWRDLTLEEKMVSTHEQQLNIHSD